MRKKVNIRQNKASESIFTRTVTLKMSKAFIKAVFLIHKKDISNMDPVLSALPGIKFGVSIFDFSHCIQKLCTFPLIFRSFLLQLPLN